MTLVPLPVIVVACLGTFAILANTLSFIMIGKINEGLPEPDRISYFWRGTEIRKKHKQLYPESRLVFLLNLCAVFMVLCFLFLIRFWVFGNSSTSP
jgi:hypothetical protein